MIETDICRLLEAMKYDYTTILDRVVRIGDRTAVRKTASGYSYRRNYERALLLVALGEHYRLKRFLEFGTGRGFVVGCVRNIVESMDFLTTVDKENPGNAQRLLRYVGAQVDGIDWIMRDSMDLGRTFKEEDWVPNLRIEYDLIFIDGQHTKDGVQNDLMLAEECSANNCIVVISDYNDTFPGIKEAVDEAVWPETKILVSTKNWIVDLGASVNVIESSGLDLSKERGSGMVVCFAGFDPPAVEKETAQ